MEESAVLHGTAPFYQVEVGTKPFSIVISENEAISLQSLKATNKRCVALSGVLTSSNLHQEAMIIN